MIKPGYYKHYKGNLYFVVSMAKHSETLENMVLYKSMNLDHLFDESSEFWVRPESMFLEEVEFEGKKISRFSKCDENGK